MFQGPVLLSDLVGLLLRFGLNPIGMIADIEKAYLQIGLNVVDRDSTRFLWIKDITKPPTPDNIIVYRFCRVLFGAIASPFLLSIVLQDLLSKPPTNKWLLWAKDQFYMDNLVISIRTTEEAIEVYESLRARLASASFNLRDWVSNDPHFMKAIGQPLPAEQKPLSVLGLNWCPAKDSVTIKGEFSPKNIHPTKRTILRYLASIFDPLGYFAPSTLELKVLIQDCWKGNIDWDIPTFASRLKLFPNENLK